MLVSKEYRDARELLKESSPMLAEFAKTPQYKKSRELMKIRYEMSLETKEVAELVRMSHGDYIELETGLKEDIKVYDFVIKELLDWYNR